MSVPAVRCVLPGADDRAPRRTPDRAGPGAPAVSGSTWRSLAAVAGLALCTMGTAVGAPVSAVDDTGARVTLAAPARRVVSLAPSVTEMIYAAGGGERLVGAVAFSDYPSAALKVPRVGNNTALDLERIAATKPDLIVVWWHGNQDRQVRKLKTLGIPVFYSEPHRLADIGSTLTRLGTLLGTDAQARAAAQAFDARIDALRHRYAARTPVSVFYQVWDKPLMTLNGTHIVSDVIALCGGRNVFGALRPLVPTVSTEAVIAANPDAIVTTRVPRHANERTGPDAAEQTDAAGEAMREPGLERWHRWPRLTAVAQGNLFAIDADLISRAAPRLADGAEQLCRDLDAVRERRRNRAAK